MSGPALRAPAWTRPLFQPERVVAPLGVRHGGPAGPRSGVTCGRCPPPPPQCLLSTTAFGHGVFFITFLEGQEEGKDVRF